MKRIMIAGFVEPDEKYENYVKAMELLGAQPFISLEVEDFDKADALILPGSRQDMNPKLWGAEDECSNDINDELDRIQWELMEKAVESKKPVLGICRGMQFINVALGGTLYQDIPSQYETDIQHQRIVKGVEIYHTATLDKDSRLAQILGAWKDVKVNSSHHQSVKELAEGFKITGKAPDGIAEAMENEDGSIICVQWHPERMQEEEMYRKLFADFIERCR